MGMFDYVRCEYPLPEGAPTTGYQTKDTPDQYLSEYVIAEDGTLLDAAGERVEFHGALEFGASNVSGCSSRGYITDDGKPAEFWEFVALYQHGKLIELSGGREESEGFYAQPPMTRADFHNWPAPTPSESEPAGGGVE